MVVQIVRWNYHPDKLEAGIKWQQGAIQRTVAVPGVVEFRSYRPMSGPWRYLVTYEFADLGAWAAWYDHEETQKVLDELHTLALDVTRELWGPSPVVPQPIRPSG